MDNALAKIERLLEENKTGEASDSLFELVVELFGKPVAIDLPPNVHMLSPSDVIAHLKTTFKTISEGHALNEPSTFCDDNLLSEDDLNLIVTTSDDYEDRQKIYVPG